MTDAPKRLAVGEAHSRDVEEIKLDGVVQTGVVSYSIPEGWITRFIPRTELQKAGKWPPLSGHWPLEKLEGRVEVRMREGWNA